MCYISKSTWYLLLFVYATQRPIFNINIFGNQVFQCQMARRQRPGETGWRRHDMTEPDLRKCGMRIPTNRDSRRNRTSLTDDDLALTERTGVVACRPTVCVCCAAVGTENRHWLRYAESARRQCTVEAFRVTLMTCAMPYPRWFQME